MLSIFSSTFESITGTTALLSILICSVLLYVCLKWCGTQHGPMGLPYIGYYPFLRNDCHVQLLELARKYGDTFLIRCTGQVYVHLGSLKAIKEAHITKSDCFSKRTTNFTLFQDTFSEGLGFSNDEKWRVLRKFFSHRLKEFGLGRKTQEDLMAGELERIVKLFRESKGREIDVLGCFTEITTTVILRLLLGGTKVDDDDTRSLIKNFNFMMTILTSRAALLAGPLLKYILQYIMPDIRRCQKCRKKMESTLLKIIRECEKEFSKDNIRNLADCFISEREELREKGDSKYKVFTESALVSTILQFFTDGSVSIGLLTALVLKELANLPDVQNAIQREVDEVVGTNRLPSWDDRSKTPYTNSVIYEVLRTCDFFPIFASLECTKEATIDGCHVPKGAITLVNFYAALYDPEVYEEPHKFDPTRFLLNEDRKPKSEVPIIFGIGKRACTGEPLTSMELFLFVTTVLQNFTLHLPEGDSDFSLETKNAYAEERILLQARPRKKI